MLCGPGAVGDEGGELVTPPLSVPVPMVVFPSWNVTLPVASAGFTVAVKVTDCPATDGLTLDVSDVLLPARDTVCVGKEPVLPAKLLSPL